MGRTGSSLVTNAQATRQIGNEQAPIAENLNEQGQNYNIANEDYTQSADPTIPTIQTVTIDNPEGENFFITMQVSVDQATWYDSGFEPYYLTTGVVILAKRFAGWWSMTNTTITLSFYSLDSSQTIYYRLVGYSKE